MQNLGFKTSDEKISDDANIEEKLNFFIDNIKPLYKSKSFDT